jgi:predicted double-glycine peptidase
MARTTHILNVPIIGQKTAFECGNTALTSVLQYFGKHYSVAEVAALANTTKDGTDHGDMIAAAVKTGATVFAASGRKSALKEAAGLVARGLPVICGWWAMWPGEKVGQVDVDYDKTWTLKERIARDCGHYSVLRGYTPTTLLFMDPQDGYAGGTIGYCEYADDEWMRIWYDTDTPQYELVKNWYMAINFEGRRFAEELGTGEDFPAKKKKA